MIFAKYLNFALFAEVEPIAIVVRLSTMHSVKIRSQYRFFFIFYSSERFFSLELLATLMKAGNKSGNVVVQAPFLEPVLATNTL